MCAAMLLFGVVQVSNVSTTYYVCASEHAQVCWTDAFVLWAVYGCIMSPDLFRPKQDCPCYFVLLVVGLLVHHQVSQ